MRGMSFSGVRGMESGLKLACKTVSKEQFYLLRATPPPVKDVLLQRSWSQCPPEAATVLLQCSCLEFWRMLKFMKAVRFYAICCTWRS